VQATLATSTSNTSQLIENVHQKTHQNQLKNHQRHRLSQYRCVLPTLHSTQTAHATGLAMMHSIVNVNMAVADKLNHVQDMKHNIMGNAVKLHKVILDSK